MKTHNIALDEVGYPIGQKWCCTETSDGFIATLVSDNGNLPTVILEGIALNPQAPGFATLLTWSKNYNFEVSFMKTR